MAKGLRELLLFSIVFIAIDRPGHPHLRGIVFKDISITEVRLG
eukprot:CAMPEP_0170493750 /NCGR_PEP_ID=MMETSP0208-20121228/14245_1 /TAXON_ID=197538 /ORGANISM="Strombidium inclinatum, Strain S3" /LENGTH=42 /DNA_ID= /DNA_START= /DNA_END= /DNA_ORIENTATION=